MVPKKKSMADTREEIAIKRGPSPTGIPTHLAQAMWDNLSVSVMIALVFLVGEMKLNAVEEAGHDVHDSHAALTACDPHDHRQLSGHGKDTYIIDLQVTLAICILLVVVTIIFESIKEFLQQNVSVQLLDVLRAMFGELMVLGFIALFT